LSRGNATHRERKDVNNLKRMAIEKWDGKLPNVAGGAIPFINVTNETK
jgi:hypothetical protein